ncbi:MAG: hypothetical protein AUI36_23780 [Cyanobacteria bacterium 13_1_40CM_2_61_4]|nr:MAG: hypothetical protein AUI36_23780 [Cyanobacteria bacterium 13_1_40CM_2_61_4]
MPLLLVTPSTRVWIGEHFDPAIRQIHDPQFRDAACRIGYSLLAPIIRKTCVGDLDQQQDVLRLRVGAAVVIRIGNTNRNIRLRLAPIIQYDRELAANTGSVADQLF